MTLENHTRVALVSGSSRGIGLQIARQLAERGDRVIVTAREEHAAERVAGELAGDGLDVLSAQLDVTDQASVDRLLSRVEHDPGRLDVLVNNAGVTGETHTGVGDADLEEVRRTLETNLFGAWRLCQAFLGLLRRSDGGRIVNLSTGMGQLAEMGSGAPAYRVSKTALNALTRILANEEAAAGILANALNPGWVRTDMGGAGATRSVEEGADTAVWLATLPHDGPTGGFFKDREPIPW
ncbi:MAG: SDR family oxidoreductase [Actinomycetota bacterium]|nr:SDR family oxidoreductase [Actinomycetota bacterium]